MVSGLLALEILFTYIKNATIGVISSPTVANAGLRIQDSGANMYVDGNSFVISTSGYLTTTGSNDFDIGNKFNFKNKN